MVMPYSAEAAAGSSPLATWQLRRVDGRGKHQLLGHSPYIRGQLEGRHCPLRRPTAICRPSVHGPRWDRAGGSGPAGCSCKKRGDAVSLTPMLHCYAQARYGGGLRFRGHPPSSAPGFLHRQSAHGSEGRFRPTFIFRCRNHRERKSMAEFLRVFAVSGTDNLTPHESRGELKEAANEHLPVVGGIFEETSQSPPPHKHALRTRKIPQTCGSWGFKFSRNLLVVSVGILLGLAASSRKRLGGYHRLVSPVYAAATEVQVPYMKPGQEWYKRKPTTGERFFYAVDHFFSTRPEGKAVVFGAIVVGTVLAGGLAFYQAAKSEGDDMEFSEAFWSAWALIADSSFHIGQRTIMKRIVAFPLTVVGLVFFALLVGLITESIESKVEGLRNDGGVALEQNHTLIIGWSPKTIKLVKQLALSNKSRNKKQKRAVVIMGSTEKRAMDEELRKAVPLYERYGSTIVTREGTPMVLDSLRKCSTSDAKSIVVLSPEEKRLPDEKDAQVLQTCLVLAYYPEAKAEVIAEMAEIDNIKVLRKMAQKLPRHPTQHGIQALPLETPEKGGLAVRQMKMIPVQAGDISLRMMVERVLQPGLAATVMELVNFAGCEFHTKEWPELVGKTFGEAVFMFKNAIPCGIRGQKPTALSSFVQVNPPLDTIIKPGDKLLVISRDEDSYSLDGPHGPAVLGEGSGVGAAMGDIKQWKPKKQNQKQKPIRMLISGWKNDICSILSVLDHSLPKGSEITMLSQVPAQEREEEIATGPPLVNINIVHAFGSPLSRRTLEELPVETYDKVMVLGMDFNSEAILDDTSSSTTAMYIRHIQVERGCVDSFIVAEVHNSDFDALDRVQTGWIDDKVDAEQVKAMILAHLAEDSDVGSVLDEIVSEKGSSLKLRQASTLVCDGEVLSFWELQERSLKRGEVVVSIKCQDNGGEWVVNPDNKDKKLKCDKREEEKEDQPPPPQQQQQQQQQKEEEEEEEVVVEEGSRPGCILSVSCGGNSDDQAKTKEEGGREEEEEEEE
ncbi:hypothetical protein CBR_g39046 [Chara braunii]|uniref:RCK N-terminal domain-containing protein n=1 Tax=Chara braunii TaxID=69332 RepID=A0A388LQY1_CHABU|nr:hypothetical protein CBR_g39046 [Chara braunii]|eukprot:GBG84671.1 hypothetical protein CBR_g39046 [Chara braunii]